VTLFDQPQCERRPFAARGQQTVTRRELLVRLSQLRNRGPEISCPAIQIDEGINPPDCPPLQLERITLSGSRARSGG
jgi:hypothetical protein